MQYGLGFSLADNEARYLQIDYANLSLISLYLPSGTSGNERQQLKYHFLEKYMEIIRQQCDNQQSMIICGDFNIAHQNIDIKNWRANQKNSGFLPDERAWLDKLFDQVGMVDAFRHKYPDKIQYTWWSNRANAWNNNVGWRIDYQVVTPDIKQQIKDCEVYREDKFSDHAPLIVNYAIDY